MKHEIWNFLSRLILVRLDLNSTKLDFSHLIPIPFFHFYSFILWFISYSIVSAIVIATYLILFYRCRAFRKLQWSIICDSCVPFLSASQMSNSMWYNRIHSHRSIANRSYVTRLFHDGEQHYKWVVFFSRSFV